MAGGGRALGAAALAASSLTLGVPAAVASSGHDPAVGYDVSFPQCDDVLPADPAFAVVGVNGGLATRPNPRPAGQLAWVAGRAPREAEGQPEVPLVVHHPKPGPGPGPGNT